MLKSNVGLHGHPDTIGVIRVMLTPPQIGANDTVTQVISAPLLRREDYVWATPDATFNGTCLVGAFVVADGQLELTWLNTDNQIVTPDPVAALVLVIRGPRFDAQAETPQPIL